MTDKEFPEADEESLTQRVREGIDDVPPSSRNKGTGKLLEDFKKLSVPARAGLIAGLCFIFIMVLFIATRGGGEGEENRVAVQNHLTQNDRLRESAEKFEDKKEPEEKFLNKEDLVARPPEPKDDAPDTYEGEERDLRNIRPSSMEDRNHGGENRAPPRDSYTGGEVKAAGFSPGTALSKRLSPEYQQALAFYTSPQVVYTREAEAGTGSRDVSAGLEPQYRNLYEGADRVNKGRSFYMAAGSEIRAVLDESIDTDHPSIVRATIISPRELSGAKALVSYSLGNDRVVAQVQKIVLPDKGTGRPGELTVEAVVRDGLPGIGGDVNHHWGPQVVAGLANASMTAGALWYATNNSSQDLTNAIVTQPIIEEGTRGVMKPVNHYGRQRAVTVRASAGQEFSIIVLTGFEVVL